MARKVTPFLMFEGQAEEAMRFYVGLFPRSRSSVSSATGLESRAPRAPSSGRTSSWRTSPSSASTAP